MALARRYILCQVWSGYRYFNVKRALCVKPSLMLNKVTVAVEGNIGCGKTTFISHFQKHDDIVEKCEEPVTLWRKCGDDNPLSAVYSNPKRWAFTFQSLVLLTLLQRHQQIQTKPVRVMERSVFSSRYCFVENLRNRSLLTDFEYVLLDEWFMESLKHNNLNIDLIVYLRTSPEICHKRIKTRNRPEEQNITLDYLQQLHDLHENWLIKGYNSSAGQNNRITPPVLVVNGDQEKEVIENKFSGIHSQIISQLQQSLG